MIAPSYLRQAALAFCALGGTATQAVAQNTYYVNGTCGNDAWTGSNQVCSAPNGPKRTIQAGIDASVSGDTVIVADGTYTGFGNRDLDFAGRDIHLRSASLDPNLCVIDCQGSAADPHRGFYFHNGETNAALLDGFTIRGGYAGATSPGDAYGGGILCNGSSPTITDIVVEKCTAVLSGGGIFCNNGSDATILDCVISDNLALEDGGGAHFLVSAATLSGCTITRNRAEYGAGVYTRLGAATITDCRIHRNQSSRNGGGVYCSQDATDIFNTSILENVAAISGGGIVSTGVALITNCTIAGNIAGTVGGGVSCGGSSAATSLTNTILWDNSATNGPEIATGNAVVAVWFCDVAGGEVGVSVSSGGTLLWGGGNIDLDPLLAFDDDTHLLTGSPCIDAGVNDPPGGLPATDPDGNPRPLDGDGNGSAIADIGAYEFNPQPPTIALSPAWSEVFVSEGGPNPDPQTLSIRNAGGGVLNWQIVETCGWLSALPPSGSSAGEINEIDLAIDASLLTHGSYECVLQVVDGAAVNSPREVRLTLQVSRTHRVPSRYPTIQAAIDAAAVPGDVVLIADGIYTGTGNKNLDFGGKRITVRSENGPTNCIIDCQNDGRGFIFQSGETRDAVVEGLTIRNGRVDENNEPFGAWGGGIFCAYFSSPTIRGCRILDCTAVASAGWGQGGGIAAWSSAPQIDACTIQGNSTGSAGGGVWCDAQTIIRDCTIENNTVTNADRGSPRGGGGIFCSESAMLINCVVRGNAVQNANYSSRNGGGGVATGTTGPVSMVNCVVAFNSVSGTQPGAGGIQVGGRGSVINCTISNNFSGSGGTGGLYARGANGGSASVANTILWANSPGQLSGSVSVVSYSNIQGGRPGTGNIAADPLFADPANGDFHITTGSPVIDAADNTAVPPAVTTDLDGSPRFVDDPSTPDCQWLPGTCGNPPIVDMGAYELQVGCAGDLDGDGDTDLADLGILLADFGCQPPPSCAGDLDGDGDTDLADLGILLADFGCTP